MRRAKFTNGSISLVALEFGQTKAFLYGQLENGGKQIFEKKRPTRLKSRRLHALLSKSRVSSKGNIQPILNSAKGFLHTMQKHFAKPEKIDDRKKEHFIKNEIDSAPSLTGEEEKMMATVEEVAKQAELRAKRFPGTLQGEAGPGAKDCRSEGRLERRNSNTLPAHITNNLPLVASLPADTVEKRFFQEHGKNTVWGITLCTIDCPAERILAELLVNNTHEDSMLHNEKNGNLPKLVWKAIDGTRSEQIIAVRKLPPPYLPRIFDVWRCWKKVVNNDGTIGYKLAISPIKNYTGTIESLPGGNQHFTPGESMGFFTIREITKNTCELVRTQNIDLHMILPKAIFAYIAKTNLAWANEIQEKYRRNEKKVDMENRSLILKRMREGITLDKDQEEMFKELESFFEVAKDGGGGKWETAESPDPLIKMQIKHPKVYKRGVRTVASGKAECTIDAGAEEVAALIFDCCSKMRTRVMLERGKNPNRAYIPLRKKGRTERENEQTMVTVKRVRERARTKGRAFFSST